MPDAPTLKLYDSIAEIRQANIDAGHDWFDRHAGTLLKGTVHEDQHIVYGRFFITSELSFHTLRYINDQANIDVVGHLQEFTTFDDAREVLDAALRIGVTVRKTADAPGSDPISWHVQLGHLPFLDEASRTEAEDRAGELRAVIAASDGRQ